MGQLPRRRLERSVKEAMMARFAESGLGVEAFCARESISPSSFYRWRSLVDESSTREGVPRRPPSVTRGSGVFVDCGALSPSREAFEFRLELGGGVVLHWVRG